MWKRELNNISDETLEEFFISEGMPRNLAKSLIKISQIGNEKIVKKNLYGFNEENYIEDEYNVFVYETIKYPPESNPHKTLNYHT